MHIHSNSFEHRHTLAAEFALGAEHGNGFGGNCNPHLAWGDVQAGTQSFALLCTDTDAPTDAPEQLTCVVMLEGSLLLMPSKASEELASEVPP